MKDGATILVPYDFSSHSVVALQAAAELARAVSGRVHLLHVVEEPSVTYPSIATGVVTEGGIPVAVLEQARAALAEVGAEVKLEHQPVLPTRVVEASSAAVGIVAFAEEIAADLIVMGTHGRTGMGHAFLGSVAERTLRQAPCPVLTLKDDTELDTDPGPADRDAARARDGNA
jgi:nucleotide-binding universal stress UspA family protein